METAWSVGACLLVVFLVLMTALMQKQLLRLRSHSDESTFIGPLSRTIADLIDTHEEARRPALLASLEEGRFRSVSVSVFSSDGDVYMDSTSPCVEKGRIPVSASERQASVFETLREKKAFESRAVTKASLLRPCRVGGKEEVTCVAATPSKDKKMLVVVTCCGSEED